MVGHTAYLTPTREHEDNMVTMPQPPLAPAPAPPAGTAPLDPRKLALGSLSAVIGGVVGAAFGGSVVMTFVGMALGPWLTAFVEHPGPHRRRRVALVALFALLVHGCKTALASVRSRPTSTAGDKATVAHTARQLGRVAVTATISLAVAILALTAGELGVGQALAGNHNTTFFGGAEASAHGPSLRMPDEVLATTSDPDGRRVTYRVTASDDHDGPLTPSCQPASGSRFAIGTRRVTCTATDAAGNVARDEFTVNVVRAAPGADTTPPIVDAPDDIRRAATSPDGRAIPYVATASDDRDGDLRTVCVPPSGSVFAIGRRDVSCTARNRARLAASRSFTVDVFDGPPVLAVESPVVVEATSAKGAPVAFTATATDAVDGALTPDCEPTSGSFFTVGDHIVRCTVTDAAGESDEATIAVTVNAQPDTTPPRILGQRTFTADSPDGLPVAVEIALRGVDDRDGSVEVTCTPDSGSEFPVGRTPVTCTASDKAGNEARPRTVLVRVDDKSIG